jgi:hypothetical protein
METKTYDMKVKKISKNESEKEQETKTVYRNKIQSINNRLFQNSR